MKKILVALAVLFVGITAFGGVASAHHLVVTGETSCVREDGSWDWAASYTIPDEDWADGLTVEVTWSPSQSGTSSNNFVVVTANWVFSNQVSGSNSTKIHKGEKCPQETTTTTTSTTTTTTTVPTTSTTQPVVTTTSAPATTTSSPASTVSPSTTAPPTTTVQDTPTTTVAVPAETTTTTAVVVPPNEEPPVPIIPATPEDLPATGLSGNIAWAALIILLLGILLVLLPYLRRRTQNRIVDPK